MAIVFARQLFTRYYANWIPRIESQIANCVMPQANSAHSLQIHASPYRLTCAWARLCLLIASSPLTLAQPLLEVPLSPQLELEILRPAFNDQLVGNDLVYSSVTNLDSLKAQLDGLHMDPERFPTAWRDLTLGAASFEPIAYGSTTERLRLPFELGRPLDAYAYVRRNTNTPPGIARMAVLLIPGSGFNQSSAIARGDPSNYHGAIIDLAAAVGDTFVVVKPNEDFLAIHNGTNKLSFNFVYTGLINLGGSYSATYLIQTLALAKHLKASYDGLVVVGLSQGGAAALLGGVNK